MLCIIYNTKYEEEEEEERKTNNNNRRIVGKELKKNERNDVVFYKIIFFRRISKIEIIYISITLRWKNKEDVDHKSLLH